MSVEMKKVLNICLSFLVGAISTAAILIYDKCDTKCSETKKIIKQTKEIKFPFIANSHTIDSIYRTLHGPYYWYPFDAKPTALSKILLTHSNYSAGILPWKVYIIGHYEIKNVGIAILTLNEYGYPKNYISEMIIVDSHLNVVKRFIINSIDISRTKIFKDSLYYSGTIIDSNIYNKDSFSIAYFSSTPLEHHPSCFYKNSVIVDKHEYHFRFSNIDTFSYKKDDKNVVRYFESIDTSRGLRVPFVVREKEN